ncbi:MAG: hypothetical protein JST80_11860 [Bdellovibrionales bacterium]|nr:hypothetical protein [Bdellovibrionales bacterium]
MKTANLLLLAMVSIQLSACSKSNILKTLDVKVAERNNDQFITLSANLNLGNAVFDQLQIPIHDPKTGLEVGSLGLHAAADGSQQVLLGVNASVALHADPALGATLPNGREFPATLGVAAGEMLAFPILNYSRIYIGGDMKTRVFIGVALAVRALDGIANLAGMPANVFFGMQVNSNLYGVAGLYGSTQANQSGIAVFGRAQLQSATPAAEAPIVLTSAKSSTAKKSTSTGLASQISNQAVDADTLHPRGERKVTNFFYGARRVIKIQ